MAYNNGFPMNYYYPQVSQPQQSNSIQNGGVINVQSEQEARDYLIAQGTSVTFINGNDKKVYVKTKGFSALDVPTFEVYNLVKDEAHSEATTDAPFVQKHEFEALKADFNAFKERMGVNEQSNAVNADA